MKTKMTVSEGLAKLKLIDKRIRKEVSGGSFVGYKIGKKIQENFDEQKAKSDFDSIQDLILYRAKLKMAINESNVKTKVNVAGKEMTVLEAIEHKKTIEYKKILLDKLRSQFSEINYKIEVGNEDVQDRLDKQIQAAFEKANKKEIDAFTKTFLENNGYSLVDPLNISKTIDDFDKEIDEFESEVDFVLSTSNAITVIEV